MTPTCPNQSGFGARRSVWSRLTRPPSTLQEIASGRILREEVLRKVIEEEVTQELEIQRRRVLEERVRREIEMKLYYDRKYPNPSYQGTRGRRGQLPHNQFNRKHWRWVREEQDTTKEIDEGEKMPEPPLIEDKVKPSNEEASQKVDNEQTFQTAEIGNKIESNARMHQKFMEVTEEEIRSPQILTLLKEDIQSSHNQEEPRLKASLPVQDEVLPNTSNIEKEQDGNNFLKPEGRKEMVKEAKACGSKRKGDSISALSTPAPTSSSADKPSPKNAKRQKTQKKEYNCTPCKVTAFTDDCWLQHLNGKRHQKTLKRLGQVEMSKTVSSNVDNTGTLVVGPVAVKMEIQKGELMPELPVSEDKVKSSNEEEIHKRKDEQIVQREEHGNKVESNVSEMSQKIVVTNGFGLQTGYQARGSVWNRMPQLLPPLLPTPGIIVSGRIWREEVCRRILEEEVRRELQLQCYYGFNYPNLGYQGTRGQRDLAPRDRFNRNQWGWVNEVQHKTMDFVEGELMPAQLLSEDKVKSSNVKEIQKKKDEQTVQTAENGNKIESNVSEMPHKSMEVTEEKIRRPQTLTLFEEHVPSSKTREELRPKASLPVPSTTLMEIEEGECIPESALSEDKVKPSNEKEIKKKKDGPTVQTAENRNKIESNVSEMSHKIMEVTEEEIKPLQTLTLLEKHVNQEELTPKASLPVQGGALPNMNNIDKEEDRNNALRKEGGKVEQLALCQTSIELNKDPQACGIKRKGDSNSAHSTPATTSSSASKLGPRKAKMQKTEKKSNKMVGLDVDNTGTPGIGLVATMMEVDNTEILATKLKGEQLLTDDGISKLQVGYVEHEVKNVTESCDVVINKGITGIGLAAVKMDNSDSLATKPTEKQLQRDEGIIKKMQVAHVEHEVETNKTESSDVNNTVALGIGLVATKRVMDNGDSLATMPTGLQTGGPSEHEAVGKNDQLWIGTGTTVLLP